MKLRFLHIAVAATLVLPTAAHAESAHTPWGLRDVGPRGTFNLCNFRAGPWLILAPCWAPGLWG